MDKYNLKSDESVLYKNYVFLDGIKGNVLLQLTNHNFIFTISRKLKIFGEPETKVKVFPVKSVKFYKDEPQIKHKGHIVEVYFEKSQAEIHFTSSVEASKFSMKAWELLTGKTIQSRGADKVKGAIGLVDDTLGIDTMDTVKGVFENGLVGSIIGGTKRKKGKANSKVGKVLDVVGDIEDACSVKEENNEIHSSALNIDEQADALKKFKDLLDSGAITQEEFDNKKKEIIG